MTVRPTADEIVATADLSDRVLLVTGGDSGIGFETARALASRGARVYLGCIQDDTGQRAADAIRRQHRQADVRPWPFNLGDLEQVREASAVLPEQKLHAVVCNAGVYGGAFARTKSGFERTFGVCYLGHAALVLGLTERLTAAAPARVVIVSSENHRWPARLDFDALPPDEAHYSELAAYGQAKLCGVMFALAFDRRHRDRGVRACALHPGSLVSTGIDKDSLLLSVVMMLARPFSPSPSEAAATSVWLATTDADIGGRYFVDRVERAPSAAALEVDAQERLWRLTEGWLAR